MTATFMGLRLLLQASCSRHTHPVRPPPLPDPWLLDLFGAAWSFGFLWLIAPHFSTSWQNASLLIHLPSLQPLLWLIHHYPPAILDQFSNTRGRPHWFLHPTRLLKYNASPRYQELYHWHPSWSLDDSIFWLLVNLTNFSLGIACLIFALGLFMVHMSIAQWLAWVGGPTWFYLPLLTFIQSHKLVVRASHAAATLHAFLVIDVRNSIQELLATDTMASL